MTDFIIGNLMFMLTKWEASFSYALITTYCDLQTVPTFVLVAILRCACSAIRHS